MAPCGGPALLSTTSNLSSQCLAKNAAYLSSKRSADGLRTHPSPTESCAVSASAITPRGGGGSCQMLAARASTSANPRHAPASHDPALPSSTRFRDFACGSASGFGEFSHAVRGLVDAFHRGVSLFRRGCTDSSVNCGGLMAAATRRLCGCRRKRSNRASHSCAKGTAQRRVCWPPTIEVSRAMGLLESVRPLYVVMYDPDAAFVRCLCASPKLSLRSCPFGSDGGLGLGVGVGCAGRCSRRITRGVRCVCTS